LSLWSGENLLSVNLSGDISVLDATTPEKPVNIIQGHCVAIEALAYDSQNETFFSADRDGKIVSWNVNTGRNRPFVGAKHTSKVLDLVVVGSDLYSVSIDDTVRTTPTSTLAYTPGVKLPSNPLGLDAANGTVFIACREHIVVFQNGKILASIAAKWGPLSVAARGNLVAVGGNDKNLYVYQYDNGKLAEIRKLSFGATVTAVAISHDGGYVAGGDSVKNYSIWKEGDKVFYGNMSSRIDCMKFSPYSDVLAIGSLDSSFILFSLSKGAMAHEQRVAHVGGLKDLVWVDNRNLLTTGQDSVIRKWNVEF